MTLALLAFGLALLPTVMALINLRLYRPLPPSRETARPRVSVLIPARNEAANIGATLAAVLADRQSELEVIVLDDGSSDGTAEIVRSVAATDPRVQLISGTLLPPGWSGKQFACHQLSRAARHEILLFLDADVRLSADGIPRMAQFLDDSGAALVSGFPREITVTPAEKLIIPLIHVMLLCYLPIPAMRRSLRVGYGAACGQLIMVRAEPYRRSFGHQAIAASRHDGVTLPRALRVAGYKTDLFDATDLATCRMYQNLPEVWNGFLKNATEGMATPLALPVWTVLLGGGHVLPWVLVAAGLAGLIPTESTVIATCAGVLTLAARAALAARFRQSLLSVALHLIGILALLAIQYQALWLSFRGKTVAWRGRG